VSTEQGVVAANLLTYMWKLDEFVSILGELLAIVVETCRVVLDLSMKIVIKI
jgi:hypothetical protein